MDKIDARFIEFGRIADMLGSCPGTRFTVVDVNKEYFHMYEDKVIFEAVNTVGISPIPTEKYYWTLSRAGFDFSSDIDRYCR